MAKKFIINNGNLVIGNVKLHKELMKDHSATKGGGYWEFNREKNIVYLYSKSMDFGQAKREDIIKAIHTGWLSRGIQKAKFFHSYEDLLSDVPNDKSGVWIEVPENNKI